MTTFRCKCSIVRKKEGERKQKKQEIEEKTLLKNTVGIFQFKKVIKELILQKKHFIFDKFEKKN